ncbi:CFI-box-CTERM domain-containing protein [Hydrogenophaga sp. OTU3427]|uniref:CFI-box-CTERM domain-containing protein n=1 Tax=Hydrogenophaga sp. OTU3427 TaxID=3043856 RepID=UPI00313C8099
MSNNQSNEPTPITNDPNKAIILHDNGLRAGNIIDQAISRLNEKQIQALSEEASKEAIRLQARQTQQNIDYVTGKKVAEDHIDVWNTLNKDGKTTRQSITTDIETGAGRMRIESKSGATCFVATVAYGDCDHPDVKFLRWYRDKILATSFLGRSFIHTYWAIGPKIAKAISPHASLRSKAKTVISYIVKKLQIRHQSDEVNTMINDNEKQKFTK